MAVSRVGRLIIYFFSVNIDRWRGSTQERRLCVAVSRELVVEHQATVAVDYYYEQQVWSSVSKYVGDAL